jgi:hypothetical protein
MDKLLLSVFGLILQRMGEKEKSQSRAGQLPAPRQKNGCLLPPRPIN